MNKMFICLAIFVLFAGTGATESKESNPLDQIAWMVGNWIGEVKTADTTPEIVEVSFDWASHKKIIYYKIQRKTASAGGSKTEGMCGWHPAKKQLVLWEVDSDGNFYESVMVVHGNKQSFEEMLYQANGATTPVRAEIIRENDNRFSFKAYVPRNGEWPEVFQVTYNRANR